jgi:hypothetical protein
VKVCSRTFGQSIGGDVSVHGWYTVIVADVNATSVIASVHLGSDSQAPPEWD